MKNLKGAKGAELLTVKELAAEWRQHPMTIYKKVAAGEIPAIRLGGRSSALRIPRDQLDARMASPRW
jgi:excisionase family DNA binding protein